MKWEPTDLAVGATVVLATLILAGAMIWISPAAAESTYPLFAEFERIDGIAEQAPVYIRGYAIGRVGAIEPRVGVAGALVFRVRMNIRSRLASGDTLFLPVGTRAELVPPPVIGAGFIVLQTPAGGGPPLEPGSTIPGTRAVAVLDQVQTVTAEVTGELLETMATARILVDTLTRTVALTNQVMAVTATELPPLFGAIERQLAEVDSLTHELREHLGSIAPLATATMDTALLVLGESRRMVGDMGRLLQESEPEMTAILANLDSTTVLLHHFVQQVSRRPWRIFTGVEPPAGYPPRGDTGTVVADSVVSAETGGPPGP